MENKKLIGYNFKDEKYIELFQKLEPHYDRNLHKKSGVDLRLNCGVFFTAEETEVLDIWFEPVYEEDIKVGDYVISLEAVYDARKKGDFFKVIRFHPTRDNKIYYKERTYGSVSGFRKATREEIEQYYINLASEKGFRNKTLIKNADNGTEHQINFGSLRFHQINDTNNTEFLTDGYGAVLYENGKWAEILEEEKFEVGDLVVVLPEDEYYWNAHGGDVAKIINIGGDNLPYSLKFDDGDINSYAKIRKATKEEIEKSKSPKLPIINGYKGVDIRESLNYGCAYLSKSWFKDSANRCITEITLSSGIKINEEQIKQIREYLN